MESFRLIKIQYEIDSNYDLNELYNLVPSHGKCNLRKNDELFPKQTTLYYLSLTNRNRAKIEAEIQKLKKRKNRGQIISKVQSALATGLINGGELQEILLTAKNNNWNSAKIKLPLGVRFIDEVYELFYLNEDYSALYDKPIYESIELKNYRDWKIKVSTLREWQNAIKSHYIPATNVDVKMSSSFTFLEEFLEAMHKATMPRLSFVSEPWIEIDDLDYLSPGILHDFQGKLNGFVNEGLSIGDMVRDGLVTKNDSGIYKISLEFEGLETSLIEQFRADFNNDGIEDIFVRGWVRAVGGTYGRGFTATLTRYSNEHLIEKINSSMSNPVCA